MDFWLGMCPTVCEYVLLDKHGKCFRIDINAETMRFVEHDLL